MRRGDHGDADDEENAAQGHQALSPQEIGQQAREKGRDDAAQEHRRHHEGKLIRVESGSCFQVGQRAGDDPHVDPVQQAAETGNEQEKT